MLLLILLRLLNQRQYQKKLNVSGRDYHSLSYRISGDNFLYCNGEKFISLPGSLTFVSAGIDYFHEVASESTQIVALFTTTTEISKCIKCISLPMHLNIEYLFGELYRQWECLQTADLKCMSQMYNIFSLFVKNSKNADCPHKKENLIRNSISYMHENFRKGHFCVESLYQYAHMSPAYYRRIFKSIYTVSPVEYLTNLRINHAKILLENGFHTISEIAEMSGYSSLSYFSSKFKDVTGVSPSEYIKK